MSWASKKTYALLFIIFVFGLVLRFHFLYPANIVVGFDQARDFSIARSIFQNHDLKIIGPTAGNNPNLHHGVLYFYYIMFPIFIFGGNPFWIAMWNAVFNAGTGIILFWMASTLFERKREGYAAAFLVSVSYLYVQYSGWLSNPTMALFTVPVFFWGLWEYYLGKRWGLLLAFLFMGLSIQTELFFIYLIPVLVIYWILLRPKFPDFKLLAISLISFILSMSTMILTEFKFHFVGIKSILEAASLVGGAGKQSFVKLLLLFLQKWDTVSLQIWPQNSGIGFIVGITAIAFMIYEIGLHRKDKKMRARNIFLLLYFFSPAIMLLLGYHNAPWFMIGRHGGTILLIVYLFSKIKYKLVVYILLLFILYQNFAALNSVSGQGETLLEPDKSSIMSYQLAAIDYTYNSSDNKEFEINTVTNPLYINAVWSYHYWWYGQSKYKFLPSWAGGDQENLYGTLRRKTGNEKYAYLIMDLTFRIPPQYKNEGLEWARSKGKVVEEKEFGDILVQKIQLP